MIERYKTIKDARQARTRKRLRNLGSRPRLTVFRSNSHIYAQVIDDVSGKTLAAASDLKSTAKLSKTNRAKETGKSLAEAAVKAKVSKVMFDRGSYKFHGRIKAVAEAAREGGLKF